MDSFRDWRGKMNLHLALYALFGISLACAACAKPGEGPKAELGYKRSVPVIAALEKYRQDHGDYPHYLRDLVPKYIESVSENVDKHPLDYRKGPQTYQLIFRYEGPGMNECFYSPNIAWKCRGYY